jgi:hypothetical protein
MRWSSMKSCGVTSQLTRPVLMNEHTSRINGYIIIIIIFIIIIIIIFIIIIIIIMSRDSSVGIATGYGLDDEGGREFDSR